MFPSPEKIGDTVVCHSVQPCSQAFDPSDVIEPYSELDILQNILSFLTYGNPLPYIAEQTFMLAFIGRCDSF